MGPAIGRGLQMRHGRVRPRKNRTNSLNYVQPVLRVALTLQSSKAVTRKPGKEPAIEG
jgi:hypothetical protein